MKTKMSMKWDGVTPEQYEAIRKIVDWEGNVPKGAVFHVSGFTNNSLRVTDIWETPEDIQHFVQNRLMPAVAQIGITTQPQVEIYPVHATFAPGIHLLAQQA